MVYQQGSKNSHSQAYKTIPHQFGSSYATTLSSKPKPKKCKCAWEFSTMFVTTTSPSQRDPSSTTTPSKLVSYVLKSQWPIHELWQVLNDQRCIWSVLKWRMWHMTYLLPLNSMVQTMCFKTSRNVRKILLRRLYPRNTKKTVDLSMYSHI